MDPSARELDPVAPEDAAEDGPEGDAHTPFWTDDPSVLLRDWNEIVPYGWFSSQRKGNALTRLGLVVGALLVLNRLRGANDQGALFVLSVLTLSVFLVVLLSRRAQTPEEDAEDFAPAVGEGVGRTGGAKPLAGVANTQLFQADVRTLDRAMVSVGQDTAAADLEWIAGGQIERAAWGPFDETDTSTTGTVQPISEGL